MSGENYYALPALPTLDPPGTPPPVALTELPDRVPPGRARRLVSAVLLCDDLRQREAWLADELKTPKPAVLTLAQLRGEAHLPHGLSAGDDGDGTEEGGPPERLPADVVWESYVRHVKAVAGALHSSLLAEWIDFEVALRNRLVVARALALRLDPGPYLLGEAEEDGDPAVAAAAQAWTEAPDPLAGLQALLRTRWSWIAGREPRYSFRDEEFLAYAVKLVILHRWHRARGPKKGRAA